MVFGGAGDEDIGRRARHADAAGVRLVGKERSGSDGLVSIATKSLDRYREAHELAFVRSGHRHNLLRRARHHASTRLFSWKEIW
jgi:hypothetical protein